MVSAIRSISVISMPSPMMSAMLPEPSEGFRWAQERSGPALVCEALEPFARHVFTTRTWPLGSASSDLLRAAAWADIAAAVGVTAEHLIRINQVHGAAVV